MSDTLAFRDRVAKLFRDKPEVWIDSTQLEAIGGRCAWRTRVSDCRLQLAMDIRNRQQRMTDADGKTWTVSWYAYFPQREADPLPIQGGHNLNSAQPGSLF